MFGVKYSKDYKKLVDAKAYAGKHYAIDDRVEIICDGAFKDCDNLEEIVMPKNLTYIIHSGFISGYQNRYGDNLKPPTNVYHRMTA